MNTSQFLKFSTDKKKTPVSSSTSYVFGPCTVQQMDASFAYEYEYLGPTTRLAATPLTDRCHLSLTMAIRASQCGTVMGPSQVGKSETVKEYAKVSNKQKTNVCLPFHDERKQQQQQQQQNRRIGSSLFS